MVQLLRFGRRLSVPSKRQIVHEMRLLEAEDLRCRAGDNPLATIGTEVPPTNYASTP